MQTNSAPYILVCDDEAPIRKVIAMRLQAAGFRVREGRSGEEGIAIVREGSPLLILTDYQMSPLSGVEMCRILRTELKVAAPALLLTARGFEWTSEELVDAGILAVIPKPFGVRQLVARVTGMIDCETRNSTAA